MIHVHSNTLKGYEQNKPEKQESQNHICQFSIQSNSSSAGEGGTKFRTASKTRSKEQYGKNIQRL